MLILLLIGGVLALGIQFCKADAVERKVGVKAGDWVKYSWNETFYSNDSEQLYYAAEDGTYDRVALQYMTITVLNVSGTTITSDNLFHYKNGTEKEFSPYITDVNESGLFVSANLSVGDTPFPYEYEYHPPPDPSLHWQYPYVERINETIYLEYLGEIREINHINRTITESLDYPPKYTSYNISVQTYYDRATGVPVEFAGIGHSVTTEGYVTNGTLSMKIIDSNLWGTDAAPEFGMIAYFLSLALATATVSIVHLRQRKKQQN